MEEKKKSFPLSVLAMGVLIVASLTLPIVAGQLEKRQNVQKKALSSVLIWQKKAEEGAINPPMDLEGDAPCKYAVTHTSGKGDVSFTIDVPSAGSYYLWTYVYALNYNANSFTVKINQDTVLPQYEIPEPFNVWKWNMVGAGFTLPAGDNTITFTGREAETKLHKVLVASDADYVPSAVVECGGGSPTPTISQTAFPSCQDLIMESSAVANAPFNISFSYENVGRPIVYLRRKLEGETWYVYEVFMQSQRSGDRTLTILAPSDPGEYEVGINVFAYNCADNYYCGLGSGGGDGILYTVDKCPRSRSEGFIKTKTGFSCTNTCRASFRVIASQITNIPTPTFSQTTPPPASLCFCPAGKPPKANGNANCDGKIDGIDFEIWREELLGLITTKRSDFNCDSKVDRVDFEIWKENRV